MKNTRTLLIFIVLCSLAIISSHFKTPVELISPASWMEYKVDMPFAGRSLAADLVRFLVNSFNIPYDSRAVRSIFMLIEFIALVLASIIVVRLSVRGSNNSMVGVIAYLLFVWQVAYMLLLTPVHKYWYAYDVLSIFTAACGLYLIIESKFKELILLVIVGTWNRETAIILSAWYFLYCSINGIDRMLIFRTGLLMVLSVVVKLLVLSVHDLHGAETVAIYEDDHLRLVHNLMFWKDPKVFWALGAFGFLWLWVPKALTYIPNSGLVRCLWSFPLYVAGMFIVGNIHEVRIYIEFVPLVTLILIAGFEKKLMLN